MPRFFYALHDSRTLMFIGVAVVITNITASLPAATGVSAGHVVEGLLAAFGLANSLERLSRCRSSATACVALRVARSRSLIRMDLPPVPCPVFALATAFVVGVILPRP